MSDIVYENNMFCIKCRVCNKISNSLLYRIFHNSQKFNHVHYHKDGKSIDVKIPQQQIQILDSIVYVLQSCEDIIEEVGSELLMELYEIYGEYFDLVYDTI